MKRKSAYKRRRRQTWDSEIATLMLALAVIGMSIPLIVALAVN